MVVNKKPMKERPTIEQLEADSRAEINQAREKQQDIAQKINEKYLDSNFYFSIVFASKDERDNWCREHSIKLQDDDYILARDYNISISRR